MTCQASQLVEVCILLLKQQTACVFRKAEPFPYSEWFFFLVNFIRVDYKFAFARAFF